MKRNRIRLLACCLLLILLTSFAGRHKVTAAGSFDPAHLVLQEKITGLTQPLAIANAGDGSGRLFIVERAGYIRIFSNGALISTPFLDIDSIVNSTSSEQGLLALAFHPSYETNGQFYTVHTAQDGSLVLSRFTRSSGNPDLANPNSRVTLLTIPHPTYTNHNGGTLAFGPDGYLYWSTGDGGGAGDPFNNAQNLNSLLGKILRLDVNNSDPGLQYAIPTSNPFFNTPNQRGEIWAYGLRNPWKFSFDTQTGDLFIADVGQSAREEIDFQAAGSTGGENYGWRIMEGSNCYNPSTGCDQSGKVLPVAEYSHSLGCSVTGGFVYRGSLYPSMNGHYFYGDFCSGILFHLYDDPGNGWTAAQVVDTPYSISTFGQDEQGELFLADYSTGKIYRMCYASLLNVAITGVNKTPASLCVGQSTRQSYPGVDDGPVKISSTDGKKIIAAMRAVWKLNGTFSSYSELMGLPKEQLSSEYYFPWYNNAVPSLLDEQFRIGNVDTTPTTVQIYIGGVLQPTEYPLGVGESVRVSFPGVNNGPVRIVSKDGKKIIAAKRSVWSMNGKYNSYSELMGLPQEQLSTEYYFPWYNNASSTLDQQLRFGNVDAVTTTVEVSIGSQATQTYELDPGESMRIAYPVEGGPVRIRSLDGKKIIAAMRAVWSRDGKYSSYSELMGLPAGQLSSEYYFPWYNNLVTHLLDEQFRLVNVDTTATTVQVSAGDIILGTFELDPGESIHQSFSTNTGPVRIRSLDGQKIIADMRAIWKLNGQNNSYAELMGLPQEALSKEYYFPWYNFAVPNLLDEQLRFGVP